MPDFIIVSVVCTRDFTINIIIYLIYRFLNL
ncbi:Uncharacterised protein [Mannheimia haemolytica]|uniref:Uncharacterized protein n=1 Tax=Mannheimia haemolytica TaxID=75985 RepID=A0A378N7E4_MANHA|nr:Uncharacterised protein [Mannheimia haemolytica]